MNLEEYREKLWIDFISSEESFGVEHDEAFELGFNSLKELDLPVKFNTWYLDHYLHAVTDIGSHTISEDGVKYLKSLKYSHPIQVEREPLVYQYWIDNIFTIK